MPSADTHQALRAALEKAGVPVEKIDAAFAEIDNKPEPAKHQSAHNAFEEARKKFTDARKAGDSEPDPADANKAEDKSEGEAA